MARINLKTIDTNREHIFPGECWCFATHRRPVIKMGEQAAKELKKALATPEFQVHSDEEE